MNWFKNIPAKIARFYTSFLSLPLAIKIFFILAILFGSVMRFQNLNNFGYYFDTVYTQYTWGKNGYEMGIFGFWQKYTGFFDYSLLSLAMETGVYAVAKIFGGGATNFVVVLKSLNWLVEIVLAAYIFRLVRKYSPENDIKLKNIKSFLIAGLTYGLPSIWFVSGVWGQNDNLIAILGAVSLELVYTQSRSHDSTLAEHDSTTTTSAKSFFTPYLEILKSNFFWSGVVFALAFWIKQQIIMILPVLILYHLKGKSWKDILNFLIWSLPVVIIFVLGVGSFESGQWENTFKIGSIGLGYICIALFAFVSRVDVWQPARRQGLGFLLVSLFIAIPCLLLNYIRTGSTLFAVIGRQNVASNGAANLWRLVDIDGNATRSLFIIGENGFLTIGTVGFVLYLVYMIAVYLPFQNLTSTKLLSSIKHLQTLVSRQLELKDSIIITTLSSGAYFMFFTKMHSRYLHFFVIFSLLSMIFIRFGQRFYSWLILVLIIHISYLLNQMGVYIGQDNPSPQWIIQIMQTFNTKYWDYFKLSSLVTLLGLLGLRSVAVREFESKTE